MKGKILYVEDDDALSFVTRDNLIQEGFEVQHCLDGQEALSEFNSTTFDICLIDVMLPKLDGFTLARKIRNLNSQIPIIFVTAKSLQEDKIKGLTIGADDYITKPFSIEELILKINIFLKRKYINDELSAKKQQIGKYSFDFANLCLECNGLTFQLTQREAELLNIFTQHPNEILKRKYLLERLWGKEDYFLGRSMDVFISRLRKYLSEDQAIEIENIHGVGFRLSVDTERPR